MSDVTPEHEHDPVVIPLVGHVLQIESSLGVIEPADGSAPTEAAFLSFGGVDSDGNEFVHHFTLNAFMCQRLAAAAATGSLILTERLAERVVACRMQAQETRRRQEDHGYM